jgi:alcohol dehydrogenase/propanol-preferring alcohol dehydrogenase
MVAPVESLARIPDDLSHIEAAPLLCAGITTFNALRNSGARPGDVVAILGVGGLGHLGVQFAAKMGCTTVAIARGKDKEALAKKLGARHYIDSGTQNVAEALTALGGAKVILATVTSGTAMSAAVGGLAIDGKLVMVGISEEPVEIPIVKFIVGRHSVQGWPCGTSADSQDTLNFSVQAGIRPMVQEFPLKRAAEAYDRMMSGEARFRVVLKIT